MSKDWYEYSCFPVLSGLVPKNQSSMCMLSFVMSPHTVHWPDLYKVAFCAGKQLSVRQTLLRTHLQKKQKEKECLLIWRDRTAWGQCSGNRRGDCQPQRGNSPVLTWQEEVQTGKVHSVWGTLLSGVQGGLLQGVTGKPRTEVSYQNQGRIIGNLMKLSFMFK